MVASSKAYDELVNFFAMGTSPAGIVNFKPSPATRERVLDLLFKEKNETLTEEEKSELEHYLAIEHLLRLAKIRARRALAA